MPRRLSPTKRASPDRRFYCQYHRDYGHDTDECRELQKTIEQLIQNGKLGNFTSSNRRYRDSKDERGDKSGGKKLRNETAGVINMIISGEVLKKKRLKRPQKDENP